MRRKVIVTWLSMLSATGIFVATTSAVYADQLSNYKHKEKSIQAQQQTTKQKIQSLGQKETDLKNKIDDIQNQINALENSIATTQAQLDRRQKQIDTLKAEIKKSQTQIDQQYKVLEQRVRVMYEDGTSSYLSVLFSSTSFSDLLDRLQLLSMIAAQDKKVLQGIQNDKKALQASNQKLTTAQTQQKQAFNALVTEKSQQEDKQSQEQNLLKSVQDDKLKQQIEFKSEADALKTLKSQIQKIIAQQGEFKTKSGWTWPVPSSHRISSGYGYRSFDGGSFHDGIDIPGSIGTPIVSATAGRVLLAGPASGFGDWVVIQSAGGLMEIYGHMYSYEIKVSPGQVVKEGQEIAGIGDNGFSTGPHLHFTVATGFDSAGYAISVNPLKYVHP